MRADDISFVESSTDSEDELDHLHRTAKEALDKAKSKVNPIFAIRSNIAFNAELMAEEDCPLPGQMVTFGVRDYLHVKDRFNQDWWIARLVRIGSNLGFIPSPAKIDAIRLSLYNSTSKDNNAINAANNQSAATNNPATTDNREPGLSSAAGGMFGSFDETQDNSNMNLVDRLLVSNPDNKKTSSTAGPIQNLAASRRMVPELDEDGGMPGDSMDNENYDPNSAMSANGPGNSAQATGSGGKLKADNAAGNATTATTTKRKPFAKKQNQIQSYEIVPCMRPVVFLGPALKGFEVTDMMQKAIFDFLRKHFEGKLILSRINADLSQLKRLGTSNIDTSSVMPQPNAGIPSSGSVAGMAASGTNNNQSNNDATTGTAGGTTTSSGGISVGLPSLSNKKTLTNTMLHIQQEIERIFELSSHMQLVVLDADTINHPSQIAKTCLAPLLVYIKIVSLKVLSRLIKNRGKSQKHNANFQLSAAEKLQQCADESFDLILDQNNLAGASECLRHFLETYWTATHPTHLQSKATRILGCRDHSTRKLSKSDPDYGISVILQPGLQAGFTAKEMLSLVGSAMGWVGNRVVGMISNTNNTSSDPPGANTSAAAATEAMTSMYDYLNWGGDPEEYRSDREMRVDQRDRNSNSSSLLRTNGVNNGDGRYGGGRLDETLTPLLKPVHPDIFLSKLSLKSQLLTHTASSNHMAPMSNHDSEPTKIYTSRSVLQQKQRLAEMEQKKRNEKDLARQRRKQVRMIMEGGAQN